MVQKIKQASERFSARTFAVSVVGVLMLSGIIALVLMEVTKAEVAVDMNGEEAVVYTHAENVGDVLNEQGIEIGEHDLVEPSVDTKIEANMTIAYTEAQEVRVSIGEDTETVWTTADTVGDLLDDMNQEVGEHDQVEPDLNERLESGMDIAYQEAFPVTVTSDGETEEVWTVSTTVGDLLDAQAIELGELDRVEPEADEELNIEEDVRVVRVEKVTDVVEETISYGTVTENDSSMARGTEEVLEPGEEGKKEKRYEVVLEDGEEVSRELIDEEVVSESQDRVVAVGTRSTQQNVSRSGNASSSSSSSSAGEWMNFTATAYTAYCTGCSGVTRTGIDLRANPNSRVIAVDPSVIPLGSRVEVEGRGTFLAADTGGAINGRKIDIFMPDRSAALAFGRQSVRVRIVE
ncbi:G5 and 3D domain-containing protein [Salisediminibacterium selenitireducens]|uniref:3D domain protein n=1 Tax=Bacillus selenitireducens (strain ATCC 700615 / DSM 15326 / MLS10) TaxID=439292 RepID=D6XV38_BACIE|nr:G5 and 3D domain-containing protein [Salisediminibacterium selenitireducens]ADH97596.1 3D domain protein [[Bacillus] selenitireducens MLS10]